MTSRIDNITKESANKEGDKNIAVSGTIDGDVNCMQFTNSRGLPGTALRTRIRGSEGDPLRVVIWGKNESDIPTVISQGARIRLLGVYAKQGSQGLEIHGNEATTVEIEGSKEAEPITGRIISVNTSDDGKRFIQTVDNKKNVYSITDLADSTGAYNNGDVIECMPSKVHGRQITLDSNSFVRKLDEDESIPKLSDVRIKIGSVEAGMSCCIEAIILKISDRRDIQTKSGESVALSDMFVEDDTGQMWVKGWRNQARLIDSCKTGDVVSITGLTARPGLEGRTDLTLSPFSSITKKLISNDS